MQIDRRPHLSPTFIGFGEAAQAFVRGWSTSVDVRDIKAYDIKTELNECARIQKKADYALHNVNGCADLKSALENASVVFSLVSADQAHKVAQQSGKYLKNLAVFFDCNSCAPHTKKQSAKVIEDCGARYIDVAVMAPVYPKLHRTPVLVSGKEVGEAAKILSALDMNVTIKGNEVGTASAIKLCRSILVKGIEALMAECVLTSISLGVEDEVFNSMETSHPGFSWREQTTYVLERMMVHGKRRSAEMNEAVKMIDELSIPARMSRSTASWQRQVADLKISSVGETLEERAGGILKGLTSNFKQNTSFT